MKLITVLRTALLLPFVLFLVPSRWRGWVSEIDPNLPPHFCLAELSWQQWQQPRLQQMLLAGYAATPLLLLLLYALLLYTGQWLVPSLFNYLVLSMVIGILFAALISVGVGLILIPVIGLVFLCLYNHADLLLLDLIWGNHLGLLWGIVGATSIAVIGNITDYSNVRSLVRQSGGFVISLMVGSILTLIVLFITSTTTQFRTLGVLPNLGIGFVIATVPASVLTWAYATRSRRWWQGVLSGLFLFFIIHEAIGNPGSEYGNAVGGDLLVWIYTISVTEMYLCLFVIAYLLILRLASPWAATIGGGLAGLGVLGLIELSTDFFQLTWNLTIAAVLIIAGITLRWWRPLLFYPFELAWTTLLLRVEEDGEFPQQRLLRFSPVYWDEQQFLPLYNLDDHLVLDCQRFPAKAQETLAHIANSRQRWAASTAQIELIARQLEACASTEQIASAATHVGSEINSSEADVLIATLRKRSEDTKVALQQISRINQRLVLSDVEEKLNSLADELLRSNHPYAKRFTPIVTQWRNGIHKTINELKQQSEEQFEIPNPYIVGVPLNRHQEIFVGRTAIAAQIESLLRSEIHPPLLIYGPRRMGKTSLLYNLRRLLPSRIIPLFVDLQGPVALATDAAGFLFTLAREITNSAMQTQGITLPPLSLAQLSSNPFTLFDQWLDELENTLSAYGATTLLLALDEFESLDTAFYEKRLGEEAVLGTLRHIVQHRPKIKLLLSGSHTLDEFQRWSSYLINVQAIHLGYLTAAEAQSLIEQPIKDFPLYYEEEAQAQIQWLTHRHPYLVQLLCSEIINLKNEQAVHLRPIVKVSDVEAAIPNAMATGSQFFADIERNQVDSRGRQLLNWLAKNEVLDDEGITELLQKTATSINDVQEAISQLLHREIIEKTHNHYKFQVELIRLWFADKH